MINDLSYASRWGDLETVKELIKAGVDVKTCDEHGNTALILASRYRHLEIVRELIRYY